jgi:hypothetical protein
MALAVVHGGEQTGKPAPPARNGVPIVLHNNATASYNKETDYRVSLSQIVRI